MKLRNKVTAASIALLSIMSSTAFSSDINGDASIKVDVDGNIIQATTGNRNVAETYIGGVLKGSNIDGDVDIELVVDGNIIHAVTGNRNRSILCVASIGC